MPTHYKGPLHERRALDAYIKLMRAADSVTRRLEALLDDRQLTPTQFGTLEALLHLGPMCQRDLATRILRSRANVTSVIDALEQRGLVRRQRGEEDRRLLSVHLTDKGRRLIESMFPAHVRDVDSTFRVLTPAEQEELGRLCKKLGLAAAERPVE